MKSEVISIQFSLESYLKLAALFISSLEGKSTSHKKNVVQVLPDESKTWNNFKRGDKEAFSLIYNRYVNVLYNYGRKIANNKVLIEDCIQDLFFELWERKEKLSNTDSIKYYLMKALRIKILKELKNQSKFLESDKLPDYYDFNLISSREAEIVNGQFSEEQKNRISAAMSKLSKRQKEALFLRYYEDFSFGDIASIMSINHQSVHNLIYRAIGVLREHLLTKKL